MLRTLSIQNLAIIEDVQVEFDTGFNVFTGATGAGKSLVIGALELLLGLRASSDVVRTGAQEARITALFEIASPAIKAEIELALDIKLDDHQLLVQRRVPASGSSRANLNGEPITAGMLRKLGQIMVDIHGQFEQQYLLQPANQLAVLDAYGKLDKRREQFQALYHSHRAAVQLRTDLQTNRDLRRQQLELYRFQADEIDQAAVEPGQSEKLELRRRKLVNAERLATELGEVYETIYEGESSVTDRLKSVAAALEKLAQFDPDLEQHAGTARDSAYALEDLAFQIRTITQKIDFNPGSLTEVEDRLQLLRRMTEKYGPTEADVLRRRDELRTKLGELEKQTEDESQLSGEIARLESELAQIGHKLTEERRKVAKGLRTKIESQLHELEMKEAGFEIRLDPAVDESGRPAPTAAGLDQIDFLIAPNPGEPPRPIRRIASGGELSRIMLGLKTVLAQADRVSVLVFDEIDSNVGGRLGSVIGQKLASLSRHHQVLCITHLPQIAAFADRQLTVHKESHGGRSFTQVELITGEKRVAELAEMIGGKNVTDTTRKQAKELLAQAKQS